MVAASVGPSPRSRVIRIGKEAQSRRCEHGEPGSGAERPARTIIRQDLRPHRHLTTAREATAALEGLGAKVSGSVSKKTTGVVFGARQGATEKTEKLGIERMDGAQFWRSWANWNIDMAMSRRYPRHRRADRSRRLPRRRDRPAASSEPSSRPARAQTRAAPDGRAPTTRAPPMASLVNFADVVGAERRRREHRPARGTVHGGGGRGATVGPRSVRRPVRLRHAARNDSPAPRHQRANIDPDGGILTNHHVVDRRSGHVKLSDGRTLGARLIGRTRQTSR